MLTISLSEKQCLSLSHRPSTKSNPYIVRACARSSPRGRGKAKTLAHSIIKGNQQEVYLNSLFYLCECSLLFTDPLPLKKRHLRKFHSTTFEPEKPVKETMRTLSNDSLCDEPLIVSSPVTLEQQVQIVLADSVNDLQPHKDNALSNHEQFSSKEETLLRVGTSHVLIANSSFSSHSAVDTLATSSSGILQRRPSDPRLVNNSPVSSTSTNPAGSPGGGSPVVSSAVSPGAVPVIGQSVVQCSQSIDSSGTPGKKKV